MLGDPTYGDAILDRLIHNAYRLDLKGKTMRPGIKPTARPDNGTAEIAAG